MYDLLKSCQTHATSQYVFPGDGKPGYIVEPRKAIDKVTKKSGVTFAPHDLRRTFFKINGH